MKTLSEKMCSVARLMTGCDTPTETINKEYNSISDTDKQQILQAIDNTVKKHDSPIDEGKKQLEVDFSIIASNFYISPATLFCLYMDYLKSDDHK